MEGGCVVYACKPGSGLSEGRVEIEFSRKYNRKTHHFHDKSIEDIWKKKCSENHRLYNASKFRLVGTVSREDGKVCLLLGLTDYKEFITTNLSDSQAELKIAGLQDHSNSQSYLSDALGVGAVLVTADDQIVLIRRNVWVAEAGGLFDVPGGHPEPEEIVRERGLTDPWESDPSDVTHELFQSILGEIHNEVNIPMDRLGGPELIGISRNPTTGGRPSVTFTVHMTSSEVRDVYNIGGVEHDESTDIKFFPLRDLSEYRDSKLYPALAPSAKGALMLFSQFHKNN